MTVLYELLPEKERQAAEEHAKRLLRTTDAAPKREFFGTLRHKQAPQQRFWASYIRCSLSTHSPFYPERIRRANKLVRVVHL